MTTPCHQLTRRRTDLAHSARDWCA